MKECTKCHVIQEDTSFRSNRMQCRTCEAVYIKLLRQTPEGLVRRIYNNQRMTTRKMGRALPAYTLMELYEWLDTQPKFAELYHSWVAGGNCIEDVPSIDRLDNHKSYSLDNIQVVTWRQNLLNQKTQNMGGEYMHTKSKAVRQLTLAGELVDEYPSIAMAIRSIKGWGGVKVTVSNVSKVCDGNATTAYGFKWEWV